VRHYNIVAINLSLGSGNYTSNPYTFLDADFTALKNGGVFISVAAGNSFYTNNSALGLDYPAVDPLTVSVGAVYDGNFGQAAEAGLGAVRDRGDAALEEQRNRDDRGDAVCELSVGREPEEADAGRPAHGASSLVAREQACPPGDHEGRCDARRQPPVPEPAMSDNEGVRFLDDMTVEDFKIQLPTRVEFVRNAQETIEAIRSLEAPDLAAIGSQRPVRVQSRL